MKMQKNTKAYNLIKYIVFQGLQLQTQITKEFIRINLTFMMAQKYQYKIFKNHLFQQLKSSVCRSNNLTRCKKEELYL